MIRVQYRLALMAATVSIASGCATALWGYEGKHGPEHWGKIDSSFAACETGKSQSPINITPPTGTTTEKIEFQYKPVQLDEVNNGHTIQVNYAGESVIRVNGVAYKLVQFHFHSPSEHQVNGKYYDMVAHLVHKSNDGKLAVVAVLFKEGAENKAIANLWKHMPEKRESRITSEDAIDAMDLLPANRSFYTYSGSLTTPPCSEGVKWFVLENPASVSRAQIEKFTHIFPKSIRPIQERNNRQILQGR